MGLVIESQTDQYVLDWWRKSAFRLRREHGVVGCRVADGGVVEISPSVKMMLGVLEMVVF